MVLETQRGVSNAKSANGLKCTNTNVSRESLQPLALDSMWTGISHNGGLGGSR